MNNSFKKKHTFEKRLSESKKILQKYNNRVPIIILQDNKSSLPKLDKIKYLVPNDITVAQFIFIIRKRISITPEEAIFVFVNETLPPSSYLMSLIYNEYKDEDGFLYLKITSENTFG